MKWKSSRHARVSCSLIEVALTPSSETILCTSRYAYDDSSMQCNWQGGDNECNILRAN